jgi:murein L,D-transpeptidase YcbB/YkuD
MLSDLRAAADASVEHGLPAQSEALEHLVQLEQQAARDGEAARALDTSADQLLSNLAIGFARGATDPMLVDADWHIPRTPGPDIELLRQAVMNGAKADELIAALAPRNAEYLALVDELARARAAGDAPKIDILRANLERWRWLPRDWPVRRIEIRVPFYQLRLHEGGAITARHAVIVGARQSQTPSFESAIETVTLNPTWTPPSSIANNELLPRFRRNPQAAADEGFDVIDRAGRIVSAADVDWRARPFPYTLRQRPGPSNALGRVRFDFPNPFAVYLHDTPSRGLFARTERALSHGCIRVAEPVALAALAIGDPTWDAAALDAAIATVETQTITLAAPLPIYVLYLTTGVDEQGAVTYAEDVYRRDAAIVRALDAPANAAAASGLGASRCALP